MSQNEASNSSNRKRKTLNLINLPRKRLRFQGSYRQQNWPFRNSFINYITKTPSNAKAWQKLIQSCKYFFAKNPIIVVDSLNFSREWEVFTNTSAGRLQKGIPPNNVSYKLWIAETLSILYGANPKDVSSIMPQICRCDATKLFFYGQILTYDEFLFFSRNIEILHLNSSCVKNGNGIVATNENNTNVPLEKLVKTLVNLKKIFGEIDPSHSCITSNTVKELLEIPHFSKIDNFTLYKIPEVFDIDTFFIYIKKNKYTEFYLYFAGSISEEYKVCLEKIVDEILQTETHNYKLPWIYFDGLAEEKKRKMRYMNERFSAL